MNRVRTGSSSVGYDEVIFLAVKNMIYINGEYIEQEKIPEDELQEIRERLFVTFAKGLGYEKCEESGQQ